MINNRFLANINLEIWLMEGTIKSSEKMLEDTISLDPGGLNKLNNESIMRLKGEIYRMKIKLNMIHYFKEVIEELDFGKKEDTLWQNFVELLNSKGSNIILVC